MGQICSINKLDLICEFLNSTQGLDKLYRLLSYVCKLIGALSVKKLLLEAIFTKLGRNLSHTRTVMRLVGLIHNFRSTHQFGETLVRNDFQIKEPWKSFKGITRLVTNYTYLPCDHLAWLGREEIIPFHSDTINTFARTSAQSWLIGLIVELVDLIKCTREIFKKFQENLRMGRLGVKPSIQQFLDDLKPLTPKTLLIIGDLPLAVNFSLRKPVLSAVTVGICGTTSSLAALYMRWNLFRLTLLDDIDKQK